MLFDLHEISFRHAVVDKQVLKVSMDQRVSILAFITISLVKDYEVLF